MLGKRFFMVLIVLGVYTSLMVNYPNELMKSLGYRQVLELYARQVCSRSTFQVLYDPGLRELEGGGGRPAVAAVIPGAGNDYSHILDQIMQGRYKAVVECSEMDSWHSSTVGQQYLSRIRPKLYRVVVFDGGHHLPTLGLAPDLIIIPELYGFAAHAQMLDAINASRIVDMAREVRCPAMIVSVPRWALVKNQTALSTLTERILARARHTGTNPGFTPQAQRRISRYGGTVFAFVNREYSKNQAYFFRQLDRLDMNGAQKVYLAFDYKYIGVAEADDFCRRLSREYGIPVERVNQPARVANVLFWR